MTKIFISPCSGMCRVTNSFKGNMKKPKGDMKKCSRTLIKKEEQNRMNVDTEKDNFTTICYYFWTINHVYDVIGMHVHCKD